jgi:mono/diheme cytochrome c family protein
MTRDCSSCHSLAYARIGGELKMLPHGHPDQVVEALRGFYGAGGGRSAAEADTSRRLPGFMEDVRAALSRFTGGPSAPSAVTGAVRQVFSRNGQCAECHTVLRPSDPNALNYRIAPVFLNDRYLPRGDFNHGIPQHNKDAHGRYTCADCHNARQSDDAREILLPKIAACAECHGKSPKQNAMAGSAECSECHSYHAPGQASPKGADQEHIALLGVAGAGTVQNVQ